jgi:Na+/melibiose symporter-like transporter
VHEIVLSDVIDADELATGVRREGMYFGVMNFVERLSLVLISGATALVLGAIAFRRFAAGGQGLGGIAMFCPCAAGSRILCPAGMSPHRVHEIEHGHGTRRG